MHAMVMMLIFFACLAGACKQLVLFSTVMYYIIILTSPTHRHTLELPMFVPDTTSFVQKFLA